MFEFLVQRAAISVVTLFVISMVVFTGVRMIPGDPARVLAGTDADAAGIDAIREKYGLNDPIPIQYLRWVGLALRGDLGHSIRTRESVITTVATKLPITIELAFLALVIAVGIAIPAGVLAAVRRNTLWDMLASGASLSGAVVTEQIFVVPGFGRLIVESVFTRDYPLVQGVVLITASSYVLINLLVDVSYSLLNPRIRIGGAARES